MVNLESYRKLQQELTEKKVTLIAVTKMKPATDIQQLYDQGHRDFGENYVQELVDKQAKLPPDIRWHFIGHLQANKVKYIAPFIHLIHSVDKQSLLKEIDKHARKHNRTIDVLLQLYIATEETKFGLDVSEYEQIVKNKSAFRNVRLRGVMGMASFSEDKGQLKKEFQILKDNFDKYSDETFSIVSSGMTNDYPIAIEQGSNMVRIGSMIFGNRS